MWPDKTSAWVDISCGPQRKKDEDTELICHTTGFIPKRLHPAIIHEQPEGRQEIYTISYLFVDRHCWWSVQMNDWTSLWRRYKSPSVLETHHSSMTFLQLHNTNPFHLLKPPSEKRFREAVVHIILSTDQRFLRDLVQTFHINWHVARQQRAWVGQQQQQHHYIIMQTSTACRPDRKRYENSNLIHIIKRSID